MLLTPPRTGKNMVDLTRVDSPMSKESYPSFSPTREDVASVSMLEKIKRDQLRRLNQSYDELQRELRKAEATRPRYLQLLTEITRVGTLIQSKSTNLIDYEKKAKETDQRYVEAINDPQCSEDDRVRLYHENEAAQEELRNAGVELREETTARKSALNESEMSEQFMKEAIQSGSKGLLGWTSHMTGKAINELNLAAKLKTDMPDVYTFDEKRRQASTTQDVLPQDGRLSVLCMSRTREPVKYSKSRLITSVPGPPDDKTDSLRGNNIAFRGNRDGSSTNFDPKYHFKKMFEVFKMHNISYKAAAIILMQTDRLDPAVRDAIRSNQEDTSFSRIFTPLPPDADIRDCFDRFKDVCAYLIDTTVFVPADSEIRAIIHDLHAPTSSIETARRVWKQALEWDNLLRNNSRHQDYYKDMWERILRDQPSIQAAFDRERADIAQERQWSRSDTRLERNISAVIQSMVDNRTLPESEETTNRTERPPRLRDQRDAARVSVVSGQSTQVYSSKEPAHSNVEEDCYSEDDEEFYRSDDYETRVTVVSSSEQLNQDLLARPTMSQGAYRKSKHDELEERLGIPPLNKAMLKVNEHTEVDALPMLSWDESKVWSKQRDNQYDLRGYRYSCRMCGRMHHCHVDCRSCDNEGKLRMVSFFYRDQEWEQALLATFKRATVFYSLTTDQKQDIVDKMRTISVRFEKN